MATRCLRREDLSTGVSVSSKPGRQEVAQDVLFKVYRKVGPSGGRGAFSWMYQSFSTAMSRLRTAQYQRSQEEPGRVSNEGEGSAEGAAGSGRLVEHVGRSRLPVTKRVFKAILALPVSIVPVMLRDIQGMSTEAERDAA